MKLFLAKVRYKRAGENGLMSVVNDSYLLYEPSFTAVEIVLNVKLREFAVEELDIQAINLLKVNDFLKETTGEYFYKVTNHLLSIGEAGKEIKERFVVILRADSIEDARNKILKEYKDIMEEIKIIKIEETPIMDYLFT